MIVLSVYNHDQLGWRCMDQFYILPSEPSPSGAPYQVAPLVADCHCVSLLLWHEYKGRRSANMHTSNANTSDSSRKNAAINILLVFCLFNLSNCKSCSWIVSYRLDYWMSKAPSWLLNSTLMRLQHWYTNLHLIYTIRDTSTWDDCRIYIYIYPTLILSTAGCVCLYAVAGNQPNYPSGDSKKGSEETLGFLPSPQSTVNRSL
jgi:hypothetical protein